MTTLLDVTDLVKLFPELSQFDKRATAPLVGGGYISWVKKLTEKYDTVRHHELFHHTTYDLSIDNKVVHIGPGSEDYSTDDDEHWGVIISVYATCNSKRLLNSLHKDLLKHIKSMGLENLKSETRTLLDKNKSHLSFKVYKFYFKGH